MPEIIPITVYQFDELDDSAKDKARRWYRQGAFDHDWYDFVFSDFEAICDILGVTLRTNPVSHVGGTKCEEPQIFFTGFASQGDGACFAGSYAYRSGSSKAIRGYAPQDARLHRIADALRNIQRQHFYQLSADIRHRGRYYHEYCMEIAVERRGIHVVALAEDTIVEAMRDLARWLYRRLESEFEYLTSEPAIDEAVIANGYTFLENGKPFS
ncbi:antitoxin of toxin-antitoxin stability system [Sphingopyxis sp.]|uniref:antitoxin of toxin-antitoxin stability system n=1 Tax=Sphingopyxis sp. TaxID=1908224 RepID=UPI002D78121C|nr:antitoxin of toxin-antitoxin stability system [Sphingopyxis sp.]HET6525038.1 antitoxin of toxin-antitoxin stability system [Sphingopyxis sp.]